MPTNLPAGGVKSPPAGLTSARAKTLLARFGPNRIGSPRRLPALKILLRQFTSPLIFILVIAAIVSGFFLHDAAEAIVIGAAVLLNTILGFFQEYKAERSLQALQKLVTPQAKVFRDQRWRTIPASDLAPGDIVALEIGRVVPADGTIIEADSLSVNEAILTGESEAAGKKALMEVYLGSTVVAGIGRFQVTRTGRRSKMGRIAGHLSSAKPPLTPLQQQVSRLAKNLGLMTFFLAGAIFILGLLRGHSSREMFELGVAVSVAAIPEGLAVTLTVILAIGMQRILKRKALVRQLITAENLGNITMICADKTGTLTEGMMRVVKLDFTDDQLGKTAIAVCNDLRDPLESVMMAAVPNAGELIKQYPRTDEIPFSPRYKYIATAHPSRRIMFVSGAPEVLLAKSTLSGKDKKFWREKFRQYGRQGYRLIAAASKPLKREKTAISPRDISGLTWLGVVIFADPVRKSVAEAIKRAQDTGIGVKVITGDYRETARAVMNGLRVFGELADDQIMEGSQLEKISDSQLADRAGQILLFARTDPDQKLRIVRALQSRGEVVAMTGDGVNDAPALKTAQVGVVVENASDVAKETADMILLDNNFSTILSAIEEGRGIFINLKKIVLYLLSDAFAEVVLIVGGLILALPTPISAVQILWVNLIDDGFPNLALAVDSYDYDRRGGLPGGRRDLIDAPIKFLIVVISAATGFFSLLLFVFFWRASGDLILARSVAFTFHGLDSLLYVFSCRAMTKPIWKRPLFDNLWLLAAVSCGFFFQLIALYFPPARALLKTAPLGGTEWGMILLMSFFVVGLIEGSKYLLRSEKANG